MTREFFYSNVSFYTSKKNESVFLSVAINGWRRGEGAVRWRMAVRLSVFGTRVDGRFFGIYSLSNGTGRDVAPLPGNAPWTRDEQALRFNLVDRETRRQKTAVGAVILSGTESRIIQMLDQVPADRPTFGLMGATHADMANAVPGLILFPSVVGEAPPVESHFRLVEAGSPSADHILFIFAVGHMGTMLHLASSLGKFLKEAEWAILVALRNSRGDQSDDRAARLYGRFEVVREMLRVDRAKSARTLSSLPRGGSHWEAVRGVVEDSLPLDLCAEAIARLEEGCAPCKSTPLELVVHATRFKSALYFIFTIVNRGKSFPCERSAVPGRKWYHDPFFLEHGLSNIDASDENPVSLAVTIRGKSFSTYRLVGTVARGIKTSGHLPPVREWSEGEQLEARLVFFHSTRNPPEVKTRCFFHHPESEMASLVMFNYCIHDFAFTVSSARSLDALMHESMRVARLAGEARKGSGIEPVFSEFISRMLSFMRVVSVKRDEVSVILEERSPKKRTRAWTELGSEVRRFFEESRAIEINP